MLLSRSILACVFSNTLYALATVWYAYITHLGYRGRFTVQYGDFCTQLMCLSFMSSIYVLI